MRPVGTWLAQQLFREPLADMRFRAAVDSTANTNLVHWGGHLLALKEVALVR